MGRLVHCSANNLLALTILMIYLPFLMAEPMRGSNMNPANLPFVVSLIWKHLISNPDKAYFCLGSLISKNLVLTSSHCLDNAIYEDVVVVIGSSDLTEAKLTYNVHSWETFTRWASQKDPRLIKLRFNDLAVIRLRNRVRGVTPANITTLTTDDLYGRNARVIGWDVGHDSRRRFLKEAEVQILTKENCEERFRSITKFMIPVSEGNLCTAANPFILNTSGDSGGPLLDENDNILGINIGICPESSFNCTEEFADQLRFNFHVNLIDVYRQFIEDMKTRYLDENDMTIFESSGCL